MEDRRIIELFQARNEAAIDEARKKYGRFCTGIIGNILSLREDAEECASDVWYTLWQKIPPEEPVSLPAFIGTVARNLSISRFRAERAKKRYNGMELLLSELDDCIPGEDTTLRSLEQAELTELLNRWLDGLDTDDRVLFLRRYWYGEPLKKLAADTGETQNQMAQRMLRLRKALRKTLETEGVTV